jgi:hypothetical protein
MEPYAITVKELKEMIKDIQEDAKLYFGSGDLSYQRLKCRGDNLFQIEFDQLYKITE